MTKLFRASRFVFLGSLGMIASTATAETFTEDVAPILYESCVTCHRPGEIAPMSLITYDEVRPWAKSIRKAVSTGAMPPWDARSGAHSFSNDISIDQGAINTIVAWVDQGAARGPASELPDLPEFTDEWKLGEPDLIIPIGHFDVPAEGEDLLITKAFRLDLPEDTWLRAVEIKPGDRRVLHHMVGFTGFFEMSGSGNNHTKGVTVTAADRQNFSPFSVWAAGSPPVEFPEGMGYRLKKDQLVSFNIHYHPYGEATSDESEVGLYFGKSDIQKEIFTGVAINTGIDIPAGSRDTVFSAMHVFPQDSRLISFFPHMHQRGKSMSYILTTPDGARQNLLDVDTYDFNWQWNYYLDKPIDVPKGSRIEVVGRWDNSGDNINNPDPETHVEFGEGTNEEMLIGFFETVPTEGVSFTAKQDEGTITDLLLAHDPESTYTLSAKTGLGSLLCALHLPKEGQGTFYMLQRGYTLTMSIRETTWLSDTEAVLKTVMIQDAGNTLPLGIHVKHSEDGEVSGGLYFGRYAPEDPSTGRPTMQFSGQNSAAEPVVSD